jgi:hypothetical protein
VSHVGEAEAGAIPRTAQEQSLYGTSTEESRAGAAGMDKNRAYTVPPPRRAELGLQDGQSLFGTVLTPQNKGVFLLLHYKNCSRGGIVRIGDGRDAGACL